MPSRSFPIVGSYYHPPAQDLCSVLRAGTPLSVLAEPDNQHDQYAIAIWLNARHITVDNFEAVDTILINFGQDLSAAQEADDSWQLGYIKKEFAKILRQNFIVTVDGYMMGEFLRGNGGSPMVSISYPGL